MRGVESAIFVAYSNKITKNWSNGIWFLMRLSGQLVYRRWLITSSWIKLVRHTSTRMTQYKWILSDNGNSQRWRICFSLKIPLHPAEIRVDVEGLMNTEEFNGVYTCHWIAYYVAFKTFFQTQTNLQPNQLTNPVEKNPYKETYYANRSFTELNFVITVRTKKQSHGSISLNLPKNNFKKTWILHFLAV